MGDPTEIRRKLETWESNTLRAAIAGNTLSEQRRRIAGDILEQREREENQRREQEQTELQKRAVHAAERSAAAKEKHVKIAVISLLIGGVGGACVLKLVEWLISKFM